MAGVEKELRQRLERLEAIHHMTVMVGHARKLEDIYEAALDCLQAALQLKKASILVFDENDVMRFRVWRGLSEAYRRAVDGHSPWSAAEKNPHTIAVEDVNEDPDLEALLEVLHGEGIRALAFIPLISQERLLGKFMLYYDRPHRFDEGELLLAESVASQIAFAIERKRSEEALQKSHEELERRVEARTALLNSQIVERKQAEETVRALLRISDKLNATLDINTLLDLLTSEAIKLANAESGFSGLSTAEGVVCRHYVQQGVTLPLAYTFPPEAGIPGWLAQYTLPYETADVATSPYATEELYKRFGVKSLLSIPIVDNNGRLIAFFEVHNKKGASEFSDSDKETLVGVSRIAAIAIQNARLFEQLHLSRQRLQELNQEVLWAQEEERRRVSRELHDSAGQALTSLLINLGLVQSELPAEAESLRRRIADARELLKNTLEEVRSLAHRLRPPALDNFGLDTALEGLCDEFSRSTGLQVDYKGANVPLLPDAASVSFYRFLQEALTNVAKHARAHTVWVKLCCDKGVLSLSVKDSGIGFDPGKIFSPSTRPKGIGLTGMQERFALLGGEVIIESQPGRGTQLVARYKMDGG